MSFLADISFNLSFHLFRRCLYSQNKYGAPIRCEICQQNCAFDSPNHKVFIVTFELNFWNEIIY